jgi:hypothetical protein
MSIGGGKMDQITPNSGAEIWPIDRLKAYARNARQPSSERIQQIAASMAEWGQSAIESPGLYDRLPGSLCLAASG